MPRQRLMRQVIPVYLLVIVLCTVCVAWFAGDAVRKFYEQRIERELEEKATLLTPHVRALLASGDRDALRGLCERIGEGREGYPERFATRFTVFTGDGVVLGESHRQLAETDGHPDWPEVLEAAVGRVGQSIRFSKRLEARVMYVAVPVRVDSRVVAVVRAAVSMHEVGDALANVYQQIAFGGLGAVVVAMGVTLGIYARRIGRPLRRLQEGAERLERGDLDRSVSVSDTAEIGALANVMNRMAARLNEKIEAITIESRERDAILASMIEGVVAIDNSQRIITLNQSAARLLDVPMRDAVGLSIYGAIRNPDLQQLFARVLGGEGDDAEGTVEIVVDGAERFLQGHGSPLLDGAGRGVGAVVVLHDVTRLRRLELVRRDFVANVSHELKTPITAIKGAAETLAAGGCGAGDIDRFAGMIVRQSDRLNAIVEDLLSLARIEQETDRGRVQLVQGAVRPALIAAVEACQAKSLHAGISVVVEVPADLRARINGPMLEQAVVNLVDNALKYSPSGTQVKVSAERRDKRVVVIVQDQGSGIDPQHHGRIFERFYRTDRARSRDAGGTGLGLAIVKHIAQAHGGQLDMDSEVGKGSTFRIWLPTDEA